MDGDRDRDPHWSTGLSSQGPVEEQKKGEYKQGSLDHEGLGHPLRQCTRANRSSTTKAGLELNKHVIKLNPLNVIDNWGRLRGQ